MITVRYGTREHNVEISDGTTINDLIRNQELRSRLRFGESVDAIINGVTQSLHSVVREGDTVILETRAATKAA